MAQVGLILVMYPEDDPDHPAGADGVLGDLHCARATAVNFHSVGGNS